MSTHGNCLDSPKFKIGKKVCALTTPPADSVFEVMAIHDFEEKFNHTREGRWLYLLYHPQHGVVSVSERMITGYK